ncbi:MAG: hypothetical protein D9V44_06370 [Actinobacteria bacterium]|nr:MAG: hypothetical protein D9V44_06370 [Actinomycetota bacterium]
MRRLTFPGFLESYVRALSGENTLALSRLAALAETESRLVEPLLLWAAVTDRVTTLSGLLEGRQALQQELQMLERLQSTGCLEEELTATSSVLRPEYSKVWNSYTVRRDAPHRDKELRLKVRERVLELESQKGVTRYRMAKDLGLNPGNLHAFLALGDATKLSLDRVAALVKYLEAA